MEGPTVEAMATASFSRSEKRDQPLTKATIRTQRLTSVFRIIKLYAIIAIPGLSPVGHPRHRGCMERALSALEAPTAAERCEALDDLTELLQQLDWALPEGEGANVAAALLDRLNDSNW